MLQYFDQIAFSLLVSLYSFIGVQSLPPSDGDWKVVDNWVHQSDDSYKLTIESMKLPERCRVSPDSYVVFPAVNLSINTVYLDGKVYQTNSHDGSWKLSEAYFKPILNCRVVLESKVVTQEITSYLKYMGAISTYPKIEKPSIGFYFLSSDLFFVSTLIIILIALINAILIVASGNLSKFHFSIIQDAAVLAVVLIISPGKYFEIELPVTNEACLSLLLTAIFMFGHTVGFVNRKTVSIFIPFVLGIYLLSMGNKNLMQFLIILFYPLIVSWICSVAFCYFRKLRLESYDSGIFYLQFIIFIMIVVCGMYDGVASQFTFNKFVLLPIGYTLLSIFNFMDIVRLLGAQKYKNYILQNEVNQQFEITNKLMANYERYQELIHDIKSPLTGLNFALSGQHSADSKMLKNLRNRLNDLLNKAQNSLQESIPSWVIFDDFNLSWQELVEECAGRIDITIEIVDVPKNLLIWCELLSVRVIIAEIFDNAIKARVQELRVEIRVSDDLNSLSINCLNQKSSKGKESVSEEGTGKGLKFIKTKIEGWDGSFKVFRPSFDSVLIFKAKIKDF